MSVVQRFLAGAGIVLAALTACSSTAHRLGAAEPAHAPPVTTAPVGSFTYVGVGPEGIVFDAASNTLAVAARNPDRLLLLDGDTGAVRATVPLPGSVRHLQLGNGVVLVPCETANQLLQVALPTGRVVARTAVQAQPHDATQVGAIVVVGNEFGHSLSVIEGGRTVRTITGPQQPGGVFADGSSVAVVDVARFTLSRYDLSNGRRLASVAAGAGPTHGANTGHGRLVVVDTRGGRLLLFDPVSLRLVASLALPGTPYGLAMDPVTDTAWVTLTARNELVGVSLAGAPRVVATYPTVRQPNTVAVAPGGHRLWVTGTDNGLVERISR